MPDTKEIFMAKKGAWDLDKVKENRETEMAKNFALPLAHS
jgi:hypothetical protein